MSDPTSSLTAARRLTLAAVLLGSALLTGHPLEAVPPSTIKMRVMSWNVGTVNPLDVRLPDRFENRVAQTIAISRVKVVCLQEVQDLAQVRRLRDKIVARGGPVYSVTMSASNPSREDGRSTAMLYTGSSTRAPVWQSSTGDQAQALVLDDVTIVNVHGPAGEYKNRRTFYPELAAWVKTLPQPVVLTGDFNIGPKGGAGLAAVLPWLQRKDKKIYRDLIAGFAATTKLGPTTMYGLIFDHLMITDGQIVTQRRMRYRRVFPMDHDPIVTGLELPLSATRTEAVQKRCGVVGALKVGALKAGAH